MHLAFSHVFYSRLLNMKRLLLLLSAAGLMISALPESSRPFVPFRTSPFDMRVHHNVSVAASSSSSTVHVYSQKTAIDNTQCPLQFTLGMSKRSHTSSHSLKSLAIVQPPITYPVFYKSWSRTTTVAFHLV